MNVADLRLHVRTHVLDARAFERTVEADSFRAAFEIATERERDEIKQAVFTKDHPALKNLIRKIVFLGSQPTLRELRVWAKNLGIKDYMRYRKDTLISLIRTTENGQKGVDRSYRGPAQEDARVVQEVRSPG